MPFDFEEYDNKCSTLSTEALQKEWENYTRHIAGGATSTAGSVLFAPITAGASLIGLGLSTPRIHNARKKRAIIEAHLQAHGSTHHTRKRDVVAPMAVAGTLGGLTLGFAGAGADLIAGEAVGKGMEYMVSHAALEVAGATLEHKHDEGKKTKDQLELAKKYGSVEGPTFDQKTSLLSPPTASQSLLRKSKSETHLDGLAYGSLPGEKRPVQPPRPTQAQPPQQNIVNVSEAPKVETHATTQAPPINPLPFTQMPQEEDKKPADSSSTGMNLPYLGLQDHDEAEKRGLIWDPARGAYVKSEIKKSQEHTETNSSSLPESHAGLNPARPESNELDDLLSKLMVENSEPTPSQPLNPVLVFPEEKSPALPARPQIEHLPPRPKSSMGTYSTPTYQSPHPQLQQYIPPPPPPQQPTHHQLPVGYTQLPYSPQQQYNPLQFSPPSPLPASAQPQYQPSHVQFPQYQYYPPPPSSSSYIPPPPPLNGRPSPQPLQNQYPQAYTQQRQDSASSITSVSSASSAGSVTSASTVSAASTPLTSYSTTTSSLTPAFSYDPALYDASPKPGYATLSPSPRPAAATMYFSPPPTEEKAKRRSYFG